jgi:hypothetical protein
MIKIDEFFEKYPQNIIGFRVNKTTKIIDVWLNNNWEIPNQEKNVNVKKQKVSEETNLTYYIVYSDSFDFVMLYDVVSSIIEHNLDIERKQNLFKEQLTKLKNLFTTLSYDELKAIQFETPYSLRQQEIVHQEPDLTESLVTEEIVDTEIVNSEEVK